MIQIWCNILLSGDCKTEASRALRQLNPCIAKAMELFFQEAWQQEVSQME